MAMPGVGPVMSNAAVAARGADEADRGDPARATINVSASTTGSWTTRPAGTATSQRRLSWCQRRGQHATSRRRPRRVATAASTHAPRGPRQRRGEHGGGPHAHDDDGRHQVAERRAQREALLVAVRRRLHVRPARSRPPPTSTAATSAGTASASTLPTSAPRRPSSRRRRLLPGTIAAHRRQRRHRGTASAMAPARPRHPRADRGHELHGVAAAGDRVADRPPADDGDGEPRDAGAHSVTRPPSTRAGGSRGAAMLAGTA